MNNTLQHHGILGMHWGVRRYQPYRDGERVKGGKEIGAATKKSARQIRKENRKAIRDRAKAQQQMQNSIKKEKINAREQTAQKLINNNKNLAKTIDDPSLLDMYIDDKDFRKEYGVTSSEYTTYKNTVDRLIREIDEKYKN